MRSETGNGLTLSNTNTRDALKTCRIHSTRCCEDLSAFKAKRDAQVLFWKEMSEEQDCSVIRFHYLSFAVITKPSTAVLLAQAPYQEPFRFLGEFIRKTLALMVAARNMWSPLLSDVSPSLEDQLIKRFLSLNQGYNCMFFCKHLACEDVYCVFPGCFIYSA